MSEKFLIDYLKFLENQNIKYILKRKVIEKLKEAEKVEIPYASWKPPKAIYEVTLVSGIRPDAIYGHLIIEYEKPKTFETRSGFEKAIEQVKGYIRDHEVEARFPRYMRLQPGEDDMERR